MRQKQKRQIDACRLHQLECIQTAEAGWIVAAQHDIPSPFHQGSLHGGRFFHPLMLNCVTALF